MSAAVALSDVSVGAGRRDGELCRDWDGDLESSGGVVAATAESEVLLKVGAALGRGCRYAGGRRGACVIIDFLASRTSS